MVIWAIYAPQFLSAGVKALLEDPENELVVSFSTVQELLNKVGRGKLLIAGTSVAGVYGRIQELADTFLAVTMDHILSAASLPQIHHDPFDRILIAQSLSGGIPLITNDAEIRDYDLPTIWK